MSYAAAVPQPKADFFDEKGFLKEYRPPLMQPTDRQHEHPEKSSNPA